MLINVLLGSQDAQWIKVLKEVDSLSLTPESHTVAEEPWLP